MTQITKGQTTKENIIKQAKKMFYEYGNAKTSLQKLADASDIKLGTLTYHFKTKNDIVRQIYSEFCDSIYNFINSENSEQHYYYKVCCFSLIFDSIVFTDTNNSRFYHECIQNESNYRYFMDFLKAFYINCLKSLNIQFTETDIDILLFSDFGFRREVTINYLEGNLDISQEQFLYYLIKNLSRLMGIDNIIIEQNISRAFDYLKNHDFSSIKFLI